MNLDAVNRFFFMGALLLFASFHFAESTTEVDDALKVQTQSGPIVGKVSEVDSSVLSFKGIPYATPPVGDLRWQPTKAMAPWVEPRDAKEFGARCMQPASAGGFYGMQAAQPVSEDCLFLNVWSQTTDVDASQPVMVWIHGGAFLFGSGSDRPYHGARLATRGVTVVTVNYRLGLYGFYAHPALTEESAVSASGNQGIHDQIAALQWVQDNISQFGGDPNNVTIFGESAGSMSVCYLVATPLAKGLFHKAIGQSGGCFAMHASLTTSGSHPDLEDVDNRSGYEIGIALASALGQPEPTKASLEAMRGLTTDEIAQKIEEAEFNFPWRSIFVDGLLFPDQMRKLMEDNKGSQVASLVGSTRDEGTALFTNMEEIALEDWKDSVKEANPAYADDLIQAYSQDAAKSTKTAQQEMLSDALFASEMRTWAELVEGQGKQAFIYVFNQAPPLPNIGRQFGAFHGGEIQYVFQAPSLMESEDGHPTLWNEGDKRTAQLMQDYWVNFAKTGNPNSDGLPNWPQYQKETRQTLGIAAETQVLTDFRKTKLDIHEKQKLDNFAITN